VKVGECWYFATIENLEDKRLQDTVRLVGTLEDGASLLQLSHLLADLRSALLWDFRQGRMVVTDFSGERL
jgi:hypothetical protein